MTNSLLNKKSLVEKLSAMTGLMEENRELEKMINKLNLKKNENTDKISVLMKETREMAEAPIAEIIDNDVEITDEVTENIDDVVEITDEVTQNIGNDVVEIPEEVTTGREDD